MKQIIFIRWWEAFYNEEQYLSYLEQRKYDPFDQTKSRRDWIERALSTEYQMIAPVMPCKQNATYKAWKIRFEKIFPYLNDEELIVIWSSLWGTFITKYLSENKFPKKITQLHLVAPLFDEVGLVDEYLWDFIFDPQKNKNINTQTDKIFLYFSTDDPICPFHNCEKYKSLLPQANIMVFNDRGHFFQPALPELLENIGFYKK